MSGSRIPLDLVTDTAQQRSDEGRDKDALALLEPWVARRGDPHCDMSGPKIRPCHLPKRTSTCRASIDAIGENQV